MIMWLQNYNKTIVISDIQLAKTDTLPSDNNLSLLILLSKLCRTAALALAEQAVEIGKGVETRSPADFRNSIRGINQTTGSMSQTDVDNIL